MNDVQNITQKSPEEGRMGANHTRLHIVVDCLILAVTCAALAAETNKGFLLLSIPFVAVAVYYLVRASWLGNWND